MVKSPSGTPTHMVKSSLSIPTPMVKSSSVTAIPIVKSKILIIVGIVTGLLIIIAIVLVIWKPWKHKKSTSHKKYRTLPPTTHPKKYRSPRTLPPTTHPKKYRSPRTLPPTTHPKKYRSPRTSSPRLSSFAKFKNRTASIDKPFNACSNWTDTSSANLSVSNLSVAQDCGGYSKVVPQSNNLSNTDYNDWQRLNGPDPPAVVQGNCPVGHLCTMAGCTIRCSQDDDCSKITGDHQVPWKCGFYKSDQDNMFCYPSDTTNCDIYNANKVKKGYGFVKASPYDATLVVSTGPACIINPDADMDLSMTNRTLENRPPMFRQVCMSCSDWEGRPCSDPPDGKEEGYEFRN